MKILYALCLLFFGSLIQGQELITYPSTSGESALPSGIETLGENDYVMYERIIPENIDSTYTKMYHLDADLEIVEQINIEGLNIYTSFKRNDTVFLFGKTNATHSSGLNNWGVWSVDSLLNLSPHQSWSFANASSANTIYNTITYKAGKYYILLTSDDEPTCDVLILDSNFALLEDFRPEGNIGKGTTLAVGDSTFAISAFSIYLYDANWKLKKKINKPREVEPLPNGRLGFAPDVYKCIIYVNGNYITVSDANSDSLSLVSGRPELFVDEQLYSVFIDEKGDSSGLLVYGDHDWNEIINLNWQSLLDIGFGDLLVMGYIYPFEETGTRGQILALKAKNDLSYPSTDDTYGEVNMFYFANGGNYSADREEALVYGFYSSCGSCPRQGIFLLRLRGEALSTSILQINAPQSISVHPNPAQSNGKVNLSWSGLQTQSWQVKFYDKQGCMVYETSLQQGLSETTILLPELPSGTYIVRAEGSGKQVHTGTVVVD